MSLALFTAAAGYHLRAHRQPAAAKEPERFPEVNGFSFGNNRGRRLEGRRPPNSPKSHAISKDADPATVSYGQTLNILINDSTENGPLRIKSSTEVTLR